MHTETLRSAGYPMVYADQRKRKVFVLPENRSFVIPPSSVRFEDKHGNQLEVPVDIEGDMTVVDVKGLMAGGYLLRVLGLAGNAIRVILF